VETLLITVAKQRNNGSDQHFLWGPFPGYITDGSNRTDRLVVGRNVTLTLTCWRVSWQLSRELRVTSEYSGRAAVFREELQSCRRTDPVILEERQRVKIQCEDSASEL
jgi:hypothetical protein